MNTSMSSEVSRSGKLRASLKTGALESRITWPGRQPTMRFV